MKKDFVIKGVVTLLLVAFMIISPEWLASSRVPVTQQKTAEREPGFQGIVSLWHIVEFKPYRGSLGSWISGAAAEFEKQHRGVYFEVESITLEECRERIERGERADVYSFPIGWAYPEDLQKIDGVELPQLKGNLSQCGVHQGELYAYPYTASGYVLILNQRLVQEMDISDANLLRQKILSGELPFSGSVMAMAVYGAKGEVQREEDFLNEKAAVLFGDARAAGDLGRKVQQGKGFPYTTAAFCNYSDLVQCMGVDDTTEKEKLGCIAEFIQLIYTQEIQAGLYGLGLVPAIQTETVSKVETETEEQLFASLENIAAPNAFQFKAYRDQLDISAAAAVGGDASAKKDFDLRLSELLHGAEIK